MRDFYDHDDAAMNLIERRWFAVSAKVKALQDECEVMHEVLEQAAIAYRGARAQLAQLEVLRDGLGERLGQLDEVRRPMAAFTPHRPQRSAA